jgi:hypothetical protein
LGFLLCVVVKREVACFAGPTVREKRLPLLGRLAIALYGANGIAPNTKHSLSNVSTARRARTC